MIEFNDELEQIEIKECLSFKNHVLPIYNEIIEDLEYERCQDSKNEMNEDEFLDYQLTLDEFLNYQLTHEDKMEILQIIEEEYESNLNYFDNASIFDNNLIKKCVISWINENFDIKV